MKVILLDGIWRVAVLTAPEGSNRYQLGRTFVHNGKRWRVVGCNGIDRAVALRD